jgi:MJ1316 RNA cyclic group end recognition domain
MTPIHELLNRIRWDKGFGSGEFEIGWIWQRGDRISLTMRERRTFGWRA